MSKPKRSTETKSKRQLDRVVEELDSAISEFDALGMTDEADALDKIAWRVTEEFVRTQLEEAVEQHFNKSA